MKVFLKKAWKLAKWLGMVLGTIVGILLLTPFFYFVFTPVALILRIRKRERLDMRWPSEEESTWQERTVGQFDKESYHRQY